MFLEMRDGFLAPEERTLATLPGLDIPLSRAVIKPVQDLATHFLLHLTHLPALSKQDRDMAGPMACRYFGVRDPIISLQAIRANDLDCNFIKNKGFQVWGPVRVVIAQQP